MYEKVHSAMMVDVEFNLLAPYFFIHTYLRYLFSSPAVGLVAGRHDSDCLWLSSFLPKKNTNVELNYTTTAFCYILSSSLPINLATIRRSIVSAPDIFLIFGTSSGGNHDGR